jgi:hypothetical protein
MRLTEFMIVIMAALVFLIPTMKKEGEPKQQQLQKAQIAWKNERNPRPLQTTRVLFESANAQEDKIADILWMKKAAETAMAGGVSYFNVLKQKKWRRFVPSLKRHTVVIEGSIQLERDPMKAEYHASDIPELPDLNAE